MKCRLRFLSSILACTAFAVPQVHAAAPLAFLPASVLFSALPAQAGPCTARPAPVALAPSLSKASALLGSAGSALERMRQQQATAGFTVAAPPANSCAALPAAPQSAALVFAPLDAAAAKAQAPLAASEFLASRRLAVAHTVFDAQWNRVSQAALSEGAVRRLSITAGQTGTARLQAVNSWVNAHVRYAEDRTLFGQTDYWADARDTLRRGAGDCEDIAILKLQVLAAAGVPREAMFLTIARDLVRRTDHALLIVRDGGTYWMLDNATNVLVDAGPAADYRPIFSYGQNGQWLHGYASQHASTAPVQPARIALSASLVNALPIAGPTVQIAMLDEAVHAPLPAPTRLAFNAP